MHRTDQVAVVAEVALLTSALSFIANYRALSSSCAGSAGSIPRTIELTSVAEEALLTYTCCSATSLHAFPIASTWTTFLIDVRTAKGTIDADIPFITSSTLCCDWSVCWVRMALTMPRAHVVARKRARAHELAILASCSGLTFAHSVAAIDITLASSSTHHTFWILGALQMALWPHKASVALTVD